MRTARSTSLRAIGVTAVLSGCGAILDIPDRDVDAHVVCDAHGVCVCDPASELDDCDHVGSCSVNMRDNPEHCGACEYSCRGAECDGTTCRPVKVFSTGATDTLQAFALDGNWAYVSVCGLSAEDGAVLRVDLASQSKPTKILSGVECPSQLAVQD